MPKPVNRSLKAWINLLQSYAAFAVLLSLTFLLASCHRHSLLQGYLEGEYIYLSSNYSGVLKQLLVSRGQ